MSSLLAQARGAAEQQNWSLLGQCVQQILMTSDSLWGWPDQVLEEVDGLLSWALQVLEFGDFQVRWDVAKVFPGLGERAIAPLVQLLQRNLGWGDREEEEDGDWELPWFIVRILGEMKSVAVIPALANVLKTRDQWSAGDELWEVVAIALARVGTDAIPQLVDLLVHDQTRLAGAKALAQMESPEVLAPLLEMATVSDPSVRAIALEGMSHFHDPRLPDYFIAALTDPSAQVRQTALRSLGVWTQEYPDVDWVNILEPLLWDLNLQVCQQAAIALSRLGTDHAVRALAKILQADTTPEPLLLEVVRALGWIETERAIACLESALHSHRSVLVREEIIQVLGRVRWPKGSRQSVQVLFNALNTPHIQNQPPRIHQLLAHSLGELGGEEAIIPLVTLLANAENNASLSVKFYAIAALRKIGPPIYDQLQQLQNQINLTADLRNGVAIALKNLSTQEKFV